MLLSSPVSVCYLFIWSAPIVNSSNKRATMSDTNRIFNSSIFSPFENSTQFHTPFTMWCPSLIFNIYICILFFLLSFSCLPCVCYCVSCRLFSLYFPLESRKSNETKRKKVISNTQHGQFSAACAIIVVVVVVHVFIAIDVVLSSIFFITY